MFVVAALSKALIAQRSALSWIWGRVHDSAELVYVGDHVRAVQGPFVGLGLLLLELLLFLLLGALGFALTLAERFL